MPRFDGWEHAFVATSFALGATADEACAPLDDAARARVQSFVDRLGHQAREERARALAAGLAHVATAIEKARLA